MTRRQLAWILAIYSAFFILAFAGIITWAPAEIKGSAIVGCLFLWVLGFGGIAILDQKKRSKQPQNTG